MVWEKPVCFLLFSSWCVQAAEFAREWCGRDWRDGEVVLFPGVPNDMSCSFENLRTADGRTVSAAFDKGKVIRKEIW